MAFAVFLCFSRGLAQEAPNRPAADSKAAAKPPSSPREFYNAGTEKLRQGKLREAEAMLETALAGQNERLQGPGLYNLGHVRFSQGTEELKKGPASGPTTDRGRKAEQLADQAIQSADAALQQGDLQKLIDAYLRGRGARRELKAATQAVRRALLAHASALRKWERSSGDFKSAVELNSRDHEAQYNADLVDQSIAKLIDSIRELQQCANAMGEKNQKLGEKMKQMRGQIPDDAMPPGAAGEDEEEDEEGKMARDPGQEEKPGREGEEMMITPEQAGWLLEGYKLDKDRRLPMGGTEEGEPRERKRPTW